MNKMRLLWATWRTEDRGRAVRATRWHCSKRWLVEYSSLMLAARKIDWDWEPTESNRNCNWVRWTGQEQPVDDWAVNFDLRARTVWPDSEWAPWSRKRWAERRPPTASRRFRPRWADEKQADRPECRPTPTDATLETVRNDTLARHLKRCRTVRSAADSVSRENDDTAVWWSDAARRECQKWPPKMPKWPSLSWTELLCLAPTHSDGLGFIIN